MRPPPFGGPPPVQQHHYMGRPPPAASGPPPMSPAAAPAASASPPVNPAEAANDKLNTLFVGAIAAGVDDGWIQKLLEVTSTLTPFTYHSTRSFINFLNRLVVI